MSRIFGAALFLWLLGTVRGIAKCLVHALLREGAMSHISKRRCC